MVAGWDKAPKPPDDIGKTLYTIIVLRFIVKMYRLSWAFTNCKLKHKLLYFRNNNHKKRIINRWLLCNLP